jgi:hypothetical protein
MCQWRLSFISVVLAVVVVVDGNMFFLFVAVGGGGRFALTQGSRLSLARLIVA